MDFSLGLTLSVLGLSAAQLTAGFILGRCFPRRPPAGTLTARGLERVAQQLFGLTDGMVIDVGEHQQQIRGFQEELSACAADPQTLGQSLVEAVRRVLEVNQRLQSRLLDAEDRLAGQRHQLQTHITAAFTDALTGLANRRAFEEDLKQRLAHAHRRGQEFCVLMMDADHFKRLNDRYGHPTGDLVLKWLSGVFRCTLGENDMIARIGGEEFVAVLPRLRLPEAARIAQRVLLAVQTTPVLGAPEELHPTVSLGLAAVRTSDTAATLVKRADEALYYAKRHGRNCGYYYDAEAYQRIETPVTAAADAPLPPTPEALDLAAACQDLRARLAEVAQGA